VLNCRRLYCQKITKTVQPMETPCTKNGQPNLKTRAGIQPHNGHLETMHPHMLNTQGFPACQAAVLQAAALTSSSRAPATVVTCNGRQHVRTDAYQSAGRQATCF
jgi:hypothetical protein